MAGLASQPVAGVLQHRAQHSALQRNCATTQPLLVEKSTANPQCRPTVPTPSLARRPILGELHCHTVFSALETTEF
jgi:hypothetical protein